MHGTPAGLPFGMPGMGVEIDGAMQQAAQPARHCILVETSLRDMLADYHSVLFSHITGTFASRALRSIVRSGAAR